MMCLDMSKIIFVDGPIVNAKIFSYASLDTTTFA